MTPEPQSLLTRERPDIWHRAIALARATTGMLYVPKLPGADGKIYACSDAPIHTPASREAARRRNLEFWRERLKTYKTEYPDQIETIKDIEREIKELIDADSENDKSSASPVVVVPDGAMEWLLHEVGHWVSATPEERALPNYGLTTETTGHDGDREWQAWGFEEIVMAPFGQSRQFAPPTQRDGAAFMRNGPMPEMATAHAERRMVDVEMDLAKWRALWGEWAQWGRAKERAPWKSLS